MNISEEYKWLRNAYGYDFNEYESRVIYQLLQQEADNPGQPLYVIDPYNQISDNLLVFYLYCRCQGVHLFAIDGDKEKSYMYEDVFFMRREHYRYMADTQSVDGLLLLHVQDFGDCSPFCEDNRKWLSYIRDLRAKLSPGGLIIIHAKNLSKTEQLSFPPLCPEADGESGTTSSETVSQTPVHNCRSCISRHSHLSVHMVPTDCKPSRSPP